MNKFHSHKPFNQLALLPPKQEVETIKILRQCISARSALAELNMACQLLPNPSVLINSIPLLEAKDSSEIENIVTTADNLFRYSHIDEENADPSTKEALRYRQALQEGFYSLKKFPLSTRTAIEICSTIKNMQMEIRKIPGTKLINQKTGDIIYTPPEGEKLLRDLMSNWERFLHSDENFDLDPLIKMSIGHYQFEAIHPFIDGNGRTGRILNILYLVHEHLLALPVLYLSHFINQNKVAYYQLLREVSTDGAWENWIIFMLNAVEDTARWTKLKILSIQELTEHTKIFIKEKLPSIYSAELIELIFTRPYCRISQLTDKGIAKRQTASLHLKEFCAIGVLKEIKVGREKIFIHSKFLQLLVNETHIFEKYGEE